VKKKNRRRFKTTFVVASPKARTVKIKEENILGYAYFDEQRIEIDPRQNSKEYLNTIIHECLHIYFPNLEEKYIIKIADDVTDIIWNRKYRRIAK